MRSINISGAGYASDTFIQTRWRTLSSPNVYTELVYTELMDPPVPTRFADLSARASCAPMLWLVKRLWHAYCCGSMPLNYIVYWFSSIENHAYVQLPMAKIYGADFP